MSHTWADDPAYPAPDRPGLRRDRRAALAVLLPVLADRLALDGLLAGCGWALWRLLEALR